MSYYVYLVEEVTEQQAKEINEDYKILDPKLRETLKYLASLEVTEEITDTDSEYNVEKLKELFDLASDLGESNLKEGDSVYLWEHYSSLTYNYSFIFELLGYSTKEVQELSDNDLLEFLKDSLILIDVNLGVILEMTDKQLEKMKDFKEKYEKLERGTQKHLTEGLEFLNGMFTSMLAELEYALETGSKNVRIKLS